MRVSIDSVTRRTSLPTLLGIFMLLHVAALGLFASGFLLTRVELTTRSACDDASEGLISFRTSDPANSTCGTGGAANDASAYTQQSSSGGTCGDRDTGCWGARHFSKTVWVIIDALRFDFVACDGPADAAGACRSRMPHLLDLAQSSGSAAQLFKFVADPPTTTMQRLRGILTGGLPTFVDVGASFSAAAVAEDNLIDQLAAAGRRLAFVGDDTWMQLFPHQFGDAAPFPSFNVQDLHTVDDGVWQYLLPAIRNASGWDVLIGHYLGVDHVGHTDDVFAATMAAKLAQMDAQVAQIVEEMASLAGPGGSHADTLLLVWGDHGQTDAGDHGGGSPPEVDSMLLALDVAALYARRHGGGSGGGGRLGSGCGSGSVGDGSGDGSGSAQPELTRTASSSIGGSNGDVLVNDKQSASGGNADSMQCTGIGAAAPAATPQQAAWPVMPQVDFAPTLAALLGVPIPYASIGRISHDLWHLRGCAAGGATGGCRQQYAAALQANAWQVQRYLEAYAASDGGALPAAELQRSEELYAAATAAGKAGAGSDQRLSRLDRYLEAAADLARRQWTQFGVAPMAAGLAVFAATVALQLAACWSLICWACVPLEAGEQSRIAGGGGGGGGSPSTLQQQVHCWECAVEGAIALAVLGYAAALFSNSFILAEGHMLAFLLAALTALLGRSTITLQLRCQQLGDCRADAAGSIDISNATCTAGTRAAAQEAAAAAADDDLQHTDSKLDAPQLLPVEIWSAQAAGPQQHNRPCSRVLHPVHEAAALTLLLLLTNWGLAAHGLVRRSGHDAMWRTAAEHHTLLVPDAAAAPAAAAATQQPAASPRSAAHTAQASADKAGVITEPAPEVELPAEGHEQTWAAGVWQAMAYLRHLGAPGTAGSTDVAARLSRLLARLQAAVTPATAAAAAIWQRLSTYGALLLLPAMAAWLARRVTQTAPAATEGTAAAGNPGERCSLKADPRAASPVQHQNTGFIFRASGRLQRAALWAAYISVALHWLWEEAGGGPAGLNPSAAGSRMAGNATCRSGLATLGDAWALARQWAGHATSGIAGSHPNMQPSALASVWQLMLAWLGYLLPSFGAARVAWSVVASCFSALLRGGSAILQLLLDAGGAVGSARLHLALPRAAYASAALAAVLSVLHALAATRRCRGVAQDDDIIANDGKIGSSSASGGICAAALGQPQKQAPAKGRNQGQAAQAVAAARVAAMELAAAVGAPLAAVLGRRGPLPLLLAAAQAAALLRLLSLRRQAQQRVHGWAGSGAPAGGLLWSLHSMQLFFCTGHFCEFAGLQYTAGFAGVEDFDFWQSGALLALNTFGSFLAAGLALPLVCLPLLQQQPQQDSAVDGVAATAATQRAAGVPGLAADDSRHEVQAQRVDQQPAEQRQQEERSETRDFRRDLRVAAMMFVTTRTLSAAVATASAAIQRRHLMVWALFAPKFLFDACILLVCDVSVLAGAAAALVIVRER